MGEKKGMFLKTRDFRRFLTGSAMVFLFLLPTAAVRGEEEERDSRTVSADTGYEIAGVEKDIVDGVDAKNFDLIIETGPFSHAIYGGYAEGVSAINNTLLMKSGTTNKPLFGGYSFGVAALGNITTIKAGTVSGKTYGGYVQAYYHERESEEDDKYEIPEGQIEINDNIVNIEGSSDVADVVGGGAVSYANTAFFLNNQVNVGDTAKTGNIFGAYIDPEGTVIAEGNSVNISGSPTINGSVLGAYIRAENSLDDELENPSFSLRYNSITLSGNPTGIKGLYGAYVKRIEAIEAPYDAFTGNMLHVDRPSEGQIIVGDGDESLQKMDYETAIVKNFEFYRFTLPENEVYDDGKADFDKALLYVKGRVLMKAKGDITAVEEKYDSYVDKYQTPDSYSKVEAIGIGLNEIIAPGDEVKLIETENDDDLILTADTLKDPVVTDEDATKIETTWKLINDVPNVLSAFLQKLEAKHNLTRSRDWRVHSTENENVILIVKGKMTMEDDKELYLDNSKGGGVYANIGTLDIREGNLRLGDTNAWNGDAEENPDGVIINNLVMGGGSTVYAGASGYRVKHYKIHASKEEDEVSAGTIDGNLLGDDSLFTFYLPKTTKANDKFTKVTGKASVDGSTVYLVWSGNEDPGFVDGDELYLIEAAEENDNESRSDIGTPENVDAPLKIGSLLQYDFKLKTNETQLIAYLDGTSEIEEEDDSNGKGKGKTQNPVKPVEEIEEPESEEPDGGSKDRSAGAGTTKSPLLPESRSIAEGYLGGLALVIRGHELLTGAILPKTDDFDYQVFGVFGGANLHYNAGGHLGLKDFTVLAGISKRKENEKGDLYFGPFVEYGVGSYHTRDTYPTIGTVNGKGHARYIGLGLLARYNFKETEDGYLYLEGSGRIGRLKDHYDSKDIKDALGNVAKYDLSSPYYGFHGGIGYVWYLNEKTDLDLSAKYYLTRIKGDSLRLTTGDPVDFHPATSSRVQARAKLSRKINVKFSPYVALAWERELDGTVNASTGRYGFVAPSLAGNTGIGELGFVWKPKPRWTIDLGLQGYFGKREGLAATLRVKYQW
ncbi:MAG: autotransporter outer membrane beta-barrel domain-containing protein [Fusobacteriaceae bacterium]|nr:autotransporter outer membrane beta-barrel domain-containing protein [Fusobacteriaceae bacterium]